VQKKSPRRAELLKTAFVNSSRANCIPVVTSDLSQVSCRFTGSGAQVTQVVTLGTPWVPPGYPPG
jgi:hypothetical protein